eukprot:scaffold1178_cov252-Pinguiococcus_pyrenoidosus.AAC.17
MLLDRCRSGTRFLIGVQRFTFQFLLEGRRIHSLRRGARAALVLALVAALALALVVALVVALALLAVRARGTSPRSAAR